MICNKPNTPVNVLKIMQETGIMNVLSAAMCSLVRTGWKPTKETCILDKVPIAYQDEYAT
jgi:hypothetical protein